MFYLFIFNFIGRGISMKLGGEGVKKIHAESNSKIQTLVASLAPFKNPKSPIKFKSRTFPPSMATML